MPIEKSILKRKENSQVKNKFQLAFSIAALFVVGIACNMSTANMSSFTVSTDKDAKQQTTSFKSGDTIYGVATISNAPGKVSVKFQLTADDVKGMTKGEMVKGSDVNIDLPSGGTATYSLPIPDGVPSGKYILTADMHNETGEKKDSKTATLDIQGSKGSNSSKADDDDDNPANKVEDKDDN
jgi:hypothetical protein